MNIRPGTGADAAQIASLHTDSWRATYAGIMPAGYLAGPVREEHADLWRTRLLAEESAEEPTADGQAGTTHLLVAVDAQRIAGFAYLVAQDDGRVLLDHLHVRQGLTGTGIGRRLLHEAFAWAAGKHPGRPVYLEVIKDNVRAATFYTRQGGRPTATRTERFPAGFDISEIEYTWTAADVADLAGLGGR